MMQFLTAENIDMGPLCLLDASGNGIAVRGSNSLREQANQEVDFTSIDLRQCLMYKEIIILHCNHCIELNILSQADAQVVTLSSAVGFRLVYTVPYIYRVLYIQFHILLFRHCEATDRCQSEELHNTCPVILCQGLYSSQDFPKQPVVPNIT